jgi:PleD family two-component response regulator
MPDAIDKILLPRLTVQKTARKYSSTVQPRALSTISDKLVELAREAEFQTFLRFERRRAERSGRCFVLLLLEIGRSLQKNRIDTLARALRDSMRETDLAGWYKTGSVIGVVFTEVDANYAPAISEVLLNKVVAALNSRLPDEVMSHICATVTIFPGKPQDERQIELQKAAG